MTDPQTLIGELERDHNRRQLRDTDVAGRYVSVDGRRYINLSSNDYLGLTACPGLQREFLETVAAGDRLLMSSSSSRLITGNNRYYGQLEATLERMYPGRSALVLGNGYMVNTGILPALTDKEDLIAADKLVHASLIDGLRLCGCRWVRYRHNDMEHLEKILRDNPVPGRVWVVTESVFSMDGDRAPLPELMELRRRYGFSLYLDEAHAVGVYGSQGEGLAAGQGLLPHVDVLVGTFGKALASTGGFAMVDRDTREVLVNRMRTLIYSTAIPPLNLMWSNFVLQKLPGLTPRRDHLARLSSFLSDEDPSATHIFPFMAGTNDRAEFLTQEMRDAGFWVTPIRYPTVPQGAARLRVSLNAALEKEDIAELKNIWARTR